MTETNREGAPTDAQIRDDIDSGATGEKLGWTDPAAAPLGTDAEAGGQATSPQARETDRAGFAHSPSSPRKNGIGGLTLYLGVALLVMGAVALIIFLN